jgi:tetratricopeptide (TPR) repeat protein
MTQFIAGHNQEAIRTFDTVIKKLEAEPWSADNQEAFARLYFRLAQLYDSENEIDSAIEAYNHVLANDGSFHAARMNRGLLYMRFDREKALADFNELIDQETELAADAYVNRAALQTDWDLRKNDYLKAIELEPTDPYYYHYLGLGALDAGEYDTARKAYADARPLLDDETRAEIVEGLQAAAEENDALKDVVTQIIALLE